MNAVLEIIVDDIIVRFSNEFFIDVIDEYKFSQTRKWRFDVAIILVNKTTSKITKIAIEFEGGVWTQGRHVRPSGFIKDIEKYNEATAEGWVVFRVCNEMLHKCIDAIAKYIMMYGE